MKTANMISRRGFRYREPFVRTARCLATQTSLLYFDRKQISATEIKPCTLCVGYSRIVEAHTEHRRLGACPSGDATMLWLRNAISNCSQPELAYQSNRLGRVDLDADCVHRRGRCHPVHAACACTWKLDKLERKGSPGTALAGVQRREAGNVRRATASGLLEYSVQRKSSEVQDVEPVDGKWNAGDGGGGKERRRRVWGARWVYRAPHPWLCSPSQVIGCYATPLLSRLHGDHAKAYVLSNALFCYFCWAQSTVCARSQYRVQATERQTSAAQAYKHCASASETLHLPHRKAVRAHGEVLSSLPPSVSVSLEDIDVAPLDIDTNISQVKLRYVGVDVVEQRICGAACQDTVALPSNIRHLLVAPRPLKNPKRDSGPASRSWTCPKNRCKSAKIVEQSFVGGVSRTHARTRVVFRECICVYHIEPANREQLFTLNKVLPFALENLDAFLLEPSLFPHIVEHVGMRLYDHML